MKDAAVTGTVSVESTPVLLALAGPHSKLLNEVAAHTGASVNVRGNVILLSGKADEVGLARRFLAEAVELVTRGVELGPHDVGPALRSLKENPEASLTELLDDVVLVSARRRQVVPKGPTQRGYIRTIRAHDLTFGVGPAGTGKTYLAMAVGVSCLLNRSVKRIVLTRPAVEAGEKLGFLPGDLAEKVNPYLRPLYDALYDMIEFEKVEQLRERGQIEVAPLAFMRGRTLNDAFIILDEAQNATGPQMRMFLTRLGFESKAVVTGDLTQTDLPAGSQSGLREAIRLLEGVKGVGFTEFSDVDVVRHPLVQRIVVAYEREDRRRLAASGARSDSDSPSDPRGEGARTRSGRGASEIRPGRNGNH